MKNMIKNKISEFENKKQIDFCILPEDQCVDDLFIKKDGSCVLITDTISDGKFKTFMLFGPTKKSVEKTLSFDDIQKDFYCLLLNEQLLVGDHVILNHLFFEEDTTDSPLFTEGEIIDNDGYWIYVEWNNGKINTYRNLDADLIKIN